MLLLETQNAVNLMQVEAMTRPLTDCPKVLAKKCHVDQQEFIQFKEEKQGTDSSSLSACLLAASHCSFSLQSKLSTLTDGLLQRCSCRLKYRVEQKMEVFHPFHVDVCPSACS